MQTSNWTTKYKKLRPEDRFSLEERYNCLKTDITPKTVEREGHGLFSNNIETMPHLLGVTKEHEDEIKRIQRLIDIDTSLEAKGGMRQRLYRRMKEIQEELIKIMPTVAETNYTLKSSGSVDFERAVVKTMYFQQRKIRLCEEWKQIKNRLEPQDPTADDINALAPFGGGRKDVPTLA